MENKERILVVEDEKSIINFISTILATNGFDTLTAETGTQALMLTASHNPDAMILDLGLPDIDGQKIIKSVREWSDVPIIVVSARSHERDKVTALDLGADDYMTKPFSTGELLARLRAALRHASQRARHRMTLRRQQPIAATVFALITENTVFFLTESIFI